MLNERVDEFDERNLFLQAVLGIVSASRLLDAALASEAAAPEVIAELPTPLDDPWLLFVLGIVAFREQAMALLGAVPMIPLLVSAPPAKLAIQDILR